MGATVPVCCDTALMTVVVAGVGRDIEVIPAVGAGGGGGGGGGGS